MLILDLSLATTLEQSFNEYSMMSCFCALSSSHFDVKLPIEVKPKTVLKWSPVNAFSRQQHLIKARVLTLTISQHIYQSALQLYG